MALKQMWTKVTKRKRVWERNREPGEIIARRYKEIKGPTEITITITIKRTKIKIEANSERNLTKGERERAEMREIYIEKRASKRVSERERR